MRDDGRGPIDPLTLRQAASLVNGDPIDPVVGPMMEFRVVSQVESVDVPGVFNHAGDTDASQVPAVLTQQIPVVAPVRTRLVEFGRAGNGDSRQPNGECIPDCPETAQFPWTIRINGQDAHSMNANRISLLVPKPGEIEHWTYVNGGGGWDHPIHLTSKKGVTLFAPGVTGATRSTDRKVGRGAGDCAAQATGRSLSDPIREYGGSYVNHCHNTVHEDFAMLMRIQL